VVCARCQKWHKWLNKAQFLSLCGVESQVNEADLFRIGAKQRRRILLRDDFTCVVCAARRMSLEQIDEGASIVSVDDLLDGKPRTIDVDEVSKRTASSRPRELHVDHFIPKEHALRLRALVSEDDWMRITRRWLITTCDQCNLGRGSELESERHLLLIYLRSIFPSAPTEEDREDLRAFWNLAQLARAQENASEAEAAG
jgi:5-methylcytosine-specific restriction endonuclease McrA